MQRAQRYTHTHTPENVHAETVNYNNKFKYNLNFFFLFPRRRFDLILQPTEVDLIFSGNGWIPSIRLLLNPAEFVRHEMKIFRCHKCSYGLLNHNDAMKGKKERRKKTLINDYQSLFFFTSILAVTKKVFAKDFDKILSSFFSSFFFHTRFGSGPKYYCY